MSTNSAAQAQSPAQKSARRLPPELNIFLVLVGIALVYDRPDRWLASGKVFAQLDTAALDRIALRDVRPWLPNKAQAAVLQFVVDHVQRRSTEGELAWELPPAVDQALVAAGLKAKLGPWTLATVRHRVAVLSTAHRLKQVANPCEQPSIRTVLSRAEQTLRAFRRACQSAGQTRRGSGRRNGAARQAG